jgi:hypothetical protein
MQMLMFESCYYYPSFNTSGLFWIISGAVSIGKWILLSISKVSLRLSSFLLANSALDYHARTLSHSLSLTLSMVVRKRTVPIERLLFAGKIIVNFCR